MREKRFFILVPSDLDFWPFSPRICTPSYWCVLCPQNLKFLTFYSFPISSKSYIGMDR